MEQINAADGLAALPELPVQYADYAVWQRQRLTGELLERQRRYWKEQLRDLPPALELPTDRPRKLQPNGCGATHHFQLTGLLVSGLRKLARDDGTTLFTVMLAAYHVWLYRYTGQTDVIVGTPVANRDRSEVQALLGYFLNTLPIRMRLNGNNNFREIVRQVRETLLGAFSQADLPFEQMVELAVKEREPGQQPLIQAMFVLLEEGLSPLRLGQAQSRFIPMETNTSKSDLLLSIQAGCEVWDCQLEYATDLFNKDSAARMAQHLVEMFRSIVESPQAPISQLWLMPKAEQRQIPAERNRQERVSPQDKCVHQLLEEQVERTPDAVAVEYNNDSLTYRALNDRANKLAYHLHSLGIGPEVLVGICLERSLDIAVALVAVLKAGGVLIPIDPDLPRARIGFMMTDTQMPWLLTQSSLLDKLPPTFAQKLCLDQELPSIPAGMTRAVPTPDVKPGNLAYAIYTSGSTGQPKGVLITQEAFLSHCGAAIKYWEYTPADRVLQFARFSFDVGIDQLLTPLLAGATVVIRGTEIWDPTLFTDVIREHRLTVVHLPPSYWQKWVESLSKDTVGKVPGDLRMVQVGGDVMPLAMVLRWRELKWLSVRLFNRYGPTETTMFSMAYEVPADGPGNDNALRVPIGRPVGNRMIYILDAQGNPVPIGITGEIHIGGETLARGYLNQPKLTDERFIPDPFSGQTGARLYKTGDLGRFLPDGNIDFLGRLDFQIKLRGYRIELGEIEAMLGRHPEVAASGVVARVRDDGDKILIAFVVARPNTEPSYTSLRDWLSEKLPDYMIPGRFVVIPALPMNSNGKLDRKALLTLEPSGGDAKRVTSEPVNLLELELIRIWRRLFQREDIGRQDNFFALGGHSLMAVRLTAEIDKLLGCKLPIATLFQSSTVESLAQRLADENWAPAWRSLVPLQPQGSKPPLFLVHGWGGDVFVFLELAKLLPPDQPSYGIQAVGLDGKSARHTTVEGMAASYVKEIISFQQDGPIYLAGFSMGGVIAYEIAQQLNRLGRRVALLALLDSGPTGKTPWSFYVLAMAAYIPKRCWLHFRKWWQLPFRERFNYIRGRWAALRYLMIRNRSRPPLYIRA